MGQWMPSLGEEPGPRYLAIVDALERDIAEGKVLTGTKLPPQREMAERLRMSIGTVSRAYSEAEKRGLVSGEVGRGTFVRVERTKPRANVGSADFALNSPPDTGEAHLVASTLAEISAAGVSDLMGYLPHGGLPRHRTAVGDWCAAMGVEAAPENVVVTNGAQHGLDIALRLMARPGDTILTEALTFSGMSALSAVGGLRLVGVELDEEGLVPDALDAAFAATGARVLYATPTLQTPTGSVMPEGRRRAIAEILQRHDGTIIEDDAYGFLPEAPVPPIASLVPERAFYLMSFAKCLSPGLRIGAMVVPSDLRDRTIAAIRATGWMAAPVMAEVVARLVRSGAMADQVDRKRRETVARDAAARSVLEGLVPPRVDVPAYHLWMPLPVDRSVGTVIGEAAMQGLTLASPHVPSSYDRAPHGIRLCLGGFADVAALEAATARLRDVVTSSQPLSYV